MVIEVKSTQQELEQDLKKLQRAEEMIVSDPNVMRGSPIYRGTRIPVQLVADMLSQGATPEEIKDGPFSCWLNQVELWFAKIEREVIARGIFTSVPDLARKLRRYINAYSANARPIQWKYSDPSRRLPANEFTATVH